MMFGMAVYVLGLSILRNGHNLFIKCWMEIVFLNTSRIIIVQSWRQGFIKKLLWRAHWKGMVAVETTVKRWGIMLEFFSWFCDEICQSQFNPKLMRYILSEKCWCLSLQNNSLTANKHLKCITFVLYIIYFNWKSPLLCTLASG